MSDDPAHDRYIKAKDTFDASLVEMRNAWRQWRGSSVGVITGWVVVWAEAMVDDDGDDCSAVAYLPSSHIPEWQTVGLLDLAKRQSVAWCMGSPRD